MQPLAITQTRLDSVPESVAKVENGPQAGLTLVQPHHPGLDFATALHGMGQRSGITGQEGVEISLNPVQESHVGNGPVFDDFGQTGA